MACHEDGQDPFEEVVITLDTSESKGRILAHSPSGKVPALKIEENGTSQTIWDSLAICETLAERHGDARLWPENAAMRAHARSIVAEMHSGFPDLRRVLSMEIAARHPTPALEDQVQADIARIIAIWSEALALCERDGGFLFGRFSIADAFFAPVVTRFETYAIHLPPVAQAYSQHVLSLAPMREWTAAAKAEVRQAYGLTSGFPWTAEPAAAPEAAHRARPSPCRSGQRRDAAAR